jgi:putative transposase
MRWLWSPSWLICTVGGAPLDVVGRYVENQKVAAARQRAG